MMHPLRTLTYLTLTALALSACSSKNDDDQKSDLSNQAFKAVKGVFKGKKAYEAGQKAARETTRAQANAIPLPSLRLRVNKTDTYGTAANIAQNGDVSTYILATGQTVQIRNGILIGTRGLGNDILSLYTSNNTVLDGLTTGTSHRTYRYLDNEGNIVPLNVRCTLSKSTPQSLTQVERTYQVVPVFEDCKGRRDSFQNIYYLDAKTDQVWQSTQWLGPFAKSVRIEILTP